MAWSLFVDESIREKVITVGGFIAESGALRDISDRWRALKTEAFGVPPDTELKFTYAQREQPRILLDRAGWPQRERVPEMLDAIHDMPLIILTDSLVDWRSGQDPRDFYLDALQWCIRRLANEVPRSVSTEPHVVVVDMPTR